MSINNVFLYFTNANFWLYGIEGHCMDYMDMWMN